MKSIIENLENKISDTEGLHIFDKWQDSFTYAIAVQRGDEIFVVYTTYGIQHYKKESCLIALRLTEHIPFDSIVITHNRDFITPYRTAVYHKGVRIGNEMYGLKVEELPFFQ